MSESLVEPSLTVRSRFVLLEKPIAAPGKCMICGAVDRPVIDFGATNDDGAVYFCVTCLTEVAKGALGLVDASELRVAQLTAANAVAQLEQSGTLTNEYITNIRSLYEQFVFNLSLLPGVDSPRLEEVYGGTGSDESAEIRDSEPEPETHNESISVEGSTSVPADRSNESKSVFSV